MKGFKYQIALSFLLSKVKNSGLTEYSPVYFNSLTKTITGDKFFLDQCFKEIIYRVQQWISHGSGWIVEEIISQYLNLSRYLPFSGSTYIKLPKELNHPIKGLINIQNEDSKCFLWYHVRHLNCEGKNLWKITKKGREIAEGLNYNCIKFPVSKKDYFKISVINEINISGFCYKN